MNYEINSFVFFFKVDMELIGVDQSNQDIEVLFKYIFCKNIHNVHEIFPLLMMEVNNLIIAFFVYLLFLLTIKFLI